MRNNSRAGGPASNDVCMKEETMETKMIRCPKCAHEQKNRVECGACGLIFARYIRHRERQKEKEVEVGAGRKSTGRGTKILGAVALMLLTAGLIYYLVRPAGQEKAAQPTVTAVPQSAPAQALAAEKKPVAGRIPERSAKREGGSSIEEARNATVSIETPWGTGSGFFVNKNYIATNRHVVEADQKELAEDKEKVENKRKFIELEKQNQQDRRKQLEEMPDGPNRQQWVMFIESREAELNKVIPQLEEEEARVAAKGKGLQPSDIKIFLADGREFRAEYLQVSSKHDLALMALHAIDSNYLSRPPDKHPLQQGDKVYTIGSPIGLRHTVTSGVFSGYRKVETDGSVLLQTDAAINPGNSGGPLIDEKGYVFGVNTLIFRDTEGIGFAIPIETIFEDFGSSLP